MRREPFTTLAAIGLATVFVWAAIPKIVAPEAFALAVYRYQLAPAWSINLLAIYLPWIELVAAVAILAPRCRVGAALVMAILLAVFTIAMGANLLRGIDVACGCFTTSEEAHALGWLNFARNALLLGLTVAILHRGADQGAGDTPKSTHKPA